MLISKKIWQDLIEEAGEIRKEKAKEYLLEGRVNIIRSKYEDVNNFNIMAIVHGKNDNYKVNIDVQNSECEVLECECKDYASNYTACKHILATIMKFEKNNYWDNSNSKVQNKELETKYKYKNFKNLINSFYNDELAIENKQEDKIEKVKIEAKMDYDKYNSFLKLEFKIGNKRMYKIKDLSEFYTKMINNETFKYGEKLEFIHKLENFEEESKPLVEFILKYAEIMVYSKQINRYSYYVQNINQQYIILGPENIDEVYNLLKNKEVIFEDEDESKKIIFKDETPDIKFTLSLINEDELVLKPDVNIFKIAVFKGKEYSYLLVENKFYRCNKEFENTTLKLIKNLRENYSSEVILRKDDLPELYSVIIPKIKNAIILKGITKEEIEKYRPEKLAVKIFLDFDENDYLILDVKFCYGNEEFNPLSENIRTKATRNLLDEDKTLNVLKKSGFMLDLKNKRFILPDDDKIFTFLQEDIEEYMKKFEVLITENFKTKEIKEPKISSLGVKIENNLLNIDLTKINISIEEIEEIMEKYKLKKKFHRLKDGSFLNLVNNNDIDFLDKLSDGTGITIQELKKGTIKLPINRSLYLNELLNKLENTTTSKNERYKEIVENTSKEKLDYEIKIPLEFKQILRDYQKVGFCWLKMLDNYKFGGILADDMGLGKTIQILSLILNYKNEKINDRKPCIVISPSSLSLNWLNEAKKFAPKLNVKVISGNREERNNIINDINNYDLIISSYDLIKRDINLYKEKKLKFKYIIADEAQYLKNSNTQNSKTVKELEGETRYALTGTPIENSLAELWSIFDFIMPGYLFQYKNFKNKFEIPIIKEGNKEVSKKLKMLIEPFILRRTKQAVLEELPEKTVTILNNKMNEEQEKIYLSYLAKVKKDIIERINIQGIEKNQIRILAILTRLRQICCHPNLFLSGYNGESSKLNQCMEIIEDAIHSKHKLLVFSGYTSMFDIMQKELEKRKIKYFRLTGATKVSDRIELVDEFNKNEEIKVFLISLKAGRNRIKSYRSRYSNSL